MPENKSRSTTKKESRTKSVSEPAKTKATNKKTTSPKSKTHNTNISINGVKKTIKHTPKLENTKSNTSKPEVKEPEIKETKNPETQKPKTATSHKPVDQKSSSFFSIFSKILSVILGLSSIFFIIVLTYLNILPTHYLIIIILAITGGCAFVLCRKKTKTAIKIPINIISILFSCIYIVAGWYISQASGFLDSLKPQEYISEQYYVIVKNDSSIHDIQELKDKTVGTFDEGIEIYQEAIKKLNESVHVNLQTANSVRSMADDLMTGELDAIYLSAVHKSVIDDELRDFSKNTRILHTIEVRVKLDESENHPEINVTTEPFTVYISGNDSYGGLIERGRSDVNMLVTVNPVTHEILLTSIPRDYYVELHGTAGAKDKLTHAGIYGVKMSIQTLEDLLDIQIDYYVKVNFSTLVDLVDTIGGIDVYSDQGFTPWTNKEIYIPEGNVHMDGAMALAFARERFAYETGDRHRTQNQRDVLNAIIKKISSSTILLTRTNDILSSLSSSIDTNVSKDEISSLVKLQLQDMPSWKISEYSLNGYDSHAYTYSMGQQELYVMEPDYATVKTAHDKIMTILEGESATKTTEDPKTE